MTITCCSSCGSQAIQRVERDWTEEYQGHIYTVPALVFYECPECGEKVYDREAMRKIEACSPAFGLALVDELCGAWAHDPSIACIFGEINEQRHHSRPRQISFIC